MKATMLTTLAAAVLLSCGGKDNKAPEKPCVSGPTSVCTLVGDGEAGYKAGKPLEARLYLPQDALFGPDGRLYVDDWNNHRIRALQLPDGDVVDVVGSGELGDGSSEPALDANLNHPTSFIFDAQGNLVIAAWHNSKIKVVDPVTGVLTDACGTGARNYAGDEGPATKAVLDLPAGVAYDTDGNLWIMDQANQVIRMIDGTGTIHRKAGKCIVQSTCMDGEAPVVCGPPSSGKFACASDPAGCPPDADHPKACLGAFADGPALEARLSQPVGQSAVPAGRIAFNQKTGDLYFADTGNDMIRVLTHDGMVQRVAGALKDDGKGGIKGYSGDGGPALQAQLNHPIDVEVAEDGTVYFTDTDNNCIRAIGTGGTISTVAGMCNPDPKNGGGFNGDGHPPKETQFNHPYGLTLHDGSLYVADTQNHRVRRVVLP